MPFEPNVFEITDKEVDKVKATASEVIGHYRDYAVLDKIDRLLNQKGIFEDGENS